MSASQTNCAAYPHAYEIIEPPKFETSYEYVPYLMHEAVGGNSQLALGGETCSTWPSGPMPFGIRVNGPWSMNGESRV